MYKRTRLVFVSIFCLRFLVSCTCNCDPGPAYEIVFNKASIRNMVEVNSQLTEGQDSIKAEDLLIYVNINGEDLSLSSDHFSFGFNSAVACNCDPTVPTYNDKAMKLSIFMVGDKQGETRIIVNDYFSSDSEYPENNNLSISELLEDQSSDQPRILFRLKCDQPDILLQAAKFEIEVLMESGKVFTDETSFITLL